ncbi:hypothetical protein BT63DRAFT_420488 [Microthyrium microscopicum]|uniref:J domain-containing protein n=1 Tax=Microthyrium microscopicum TaxID=703497 RepID=A0A6A6UWC0_9PEZI|nr:hypothetical protein BT63DRAFT_420488 [Microthyrium microscopicum]
MVKADPKRNYYADLDVSPAASTDDIKKQFRKLARLYHPDRNPGKELEYVPKFQAIQAAHEVLGDPDQRAKYDADRKRLGYGARAVPKPSPYPSTFRQPRPRPPPQPAHFPPPSQAFPRPPPRPQPPPRQASNHPNRPPPQNPYNTSTRPSAAPTGASKFTNPTGPNRFAQFYPPRPAAAKDDANLRDNVFNAWQNMNKTHSRPNTGTQPSTPGSGDDTGADRNHGPFGRASAAHPGIHRSNTTRAPRKNGFDPNAPGDFWEPAAKQTSSYKTRPHFTEGNTDGMFPPNFVPTHDQEDEFAQPKPKRHSEHMHPQSFPNMRNVDQDMSYGERISSPYQGSGGEKVSVGAAEFLQRSTSVKDQARMAADYESAGSNPSSKKTTPRAKSSSPHNAPSNQASPGANARKQPFVSDLSESDSSSGSSGFSAKAQTGNFNIPQARKVAMPSRKWTVSPNKDGKQPVDTSFASKDWTGVFEGNNLFGPPQLGPQTSRSRPSPMRTSRKNSTSPVYINISDTVPINTNTPFPSAGETQPSPVNPSPANPSPPVKFSAEEWGKYFKQPSLFVPDINNLSQQSRPPSTVRKPLRPRTMSKTADRPNFDAKGANRDGKPTSRSASTGGSKEDVDAMDIDVDMTPPFRGAGRSDSGNVRMVPAAPQRADWRDMLETKPVASGSSAIPLGQPTIPTAVPSAVPNAVPPPNQHIPPPPPGPPPNFSSRPTTGGASAPEEIPPSLNLADLKSNLTKRAASGSVDIGDLSTSLPFNSGTSDRHPTAPSNAPLNIPKAPQPPQLPTGRRMTHEEWKQHVGNMSAYMGYWYQFEDKMIQHFATRHVDATKFGTGIPNQAATNLLEASGDIRDGGIERYAETLEQDRRVREFWSSACNRHQKCVMDFVKIKGRVRKEGFGPPIITAQ